MGSAKQEVIRLVDECKPTILAVQETFYGNNFMVKIPGYNGICKQGHFNQRFHGGVAMYIHSSCAYEEIPIQSEFQVVAAKVQLNGPRCITVASIYIPGRVGINADDFQALLRQLRPPFLLLGDLNSHNEVWGCLTTDSRGRLVERVIGNMQLNILNDGSSTHDSGSAIDLSIASSDLSAEVEWVVLPSVLSSDHFPLRIDILGRAILPQVDSQRYNYKKADWDSFGMDLVWTSLPATDVFETPQDMVQDLYSRFYTAADRTIPLYTPRRFYPRPFWNAECKRMWNERERLYRRYKTTGSLADKVHWKRVRALTKQFFKSEKKKEMQNYLSNMKHNEPMSKIYEKLRQIRGRPPRHIAILKDHGNSVSEHSDIANCLARSFASTSTYNNHSDKFKKFQSASEKHNINFNTNIEEHYNVPFALVELRSALSSAGDTSPGPDRIHYLMLKNLPEDAQSYLLSFYNRLWATKYFPEEWQISTVIPIPKPGKDHSSPENYRPIALTSCLCKLFEKMINRRLIEFLENKKLLAHVQCGFRKNRATIDHLVRLDTFIRKAFASDQVTVGVFFDLAKAYDTTWRYGILRDMYDMGLRGTLPEYVRRFLSHRRFRVAVNWELSDEHIQVAGVPQGSILSVTLFAIKINSLSTIIPPTIHSSLFVDDVQIAYSGHNMQSVLSRLQPVVNSLTNWAQTNGFQFSIAKTHCMVFHPKPNYPVLPVLRMNGQPLPVEKLVKFLGLYWDSQLTWKPHITKLKASCNSALNLLRTLSSREWGADQHIMLQTYRLIVRPKLDYGCIVYSAAATAVLREIDSIHNEALRICSGAFRSSPVESLYILMNEPSLSDRRTDLVCRYFFKCKSFITNPAYSSVVNTNLQLFFDSRTRKVNPVILRVREAINALSLPINPVLPYKTPNLYSWLLRRPTVDCSLATPLTKSIINFYPIFCDHVHDNFPEFLHIYTDGSKDEGKVGAAAVFGQRTRQTTLPKVASVYTAEMQALMLACDLIAEDQDHAIGKYLICTDSLSAAQGLLTMDPTNHFMHRLQTRLHFILVRGLEVVVLWIPSHQSIPGNNLADRAAKRASNGIPAFICCPYTDWYPNIKQAVYARWKERWSNGNGKLLSISDTPGSWKKLTVTRKEGVIISRLRIGHTLFSHGHLMDADVQQPAPPCPLCYGSVLTVEHVLIDCPNLNNQRHVAFAHLQGQQLTMKNLLGKDMKPAPVIGFIRGLNIDV